MTDGEWLTYTEAAKRLGTTPDAIRQRIRRGQMRGSRGNDGRPRVWSDALPAEQPIGPSPNSSNRTESEMFGQVKALESHVETLKTQISRAERQADEARKRVDDLSDQLAIAERERATDREARAVAEANLARLQAELKWERAELARARRPWWQRIIGR